MPRHKRWVRSVSVENCQVIERVPGEFSFTGEGLRYERFLNLVDRASQRVFARHGLIAKEGNK
jgi:hypothetical protein